MFAQFEHGQIEVGDGEADAVRKVVERVQEIHIGNTGKSQEAAHCLEAGMRDDEGSDILEHLRLIAAQFSTGPGENVECHAVVVEQHGFESRNVLSDVSQHPLPSGLAVGMTEEGLDRAVDQAMHRGGSHGFARHHAR